jgi:hypothetical protein
MEMVVEFQFSFNPKFIIPDPESLAGLGKETHGKSPTCTSEDDP